MRNKHRATSKRSRFGLTTIETLFSECVTSVVLFLSVEQEKEAEKRRSPAERTKTGQLTLAVSHHSDERWLAPPTLHARRKHTAGRRCHVPTEAPPTRRSAQSINQRPAATAGKAQDPDRVDL